jgi:DNA-binding MarR family transcriptional regulator
MVNQTLFESYERINTTFYYNFEYYYFVAVRQLLPNGLDLRDVLILSTIEQMEKTKTNTSTQIASNVSMSASAFSNYLRTLEKEELVERERGNSNRKLMYISLTPRGRELNKVVKQFSQGLVKRLVSTFGLATSLKYLNMIITLSHEDPSTPAPKLSVFSPQKALTIISDALRRINFNLYTKEELALSALTPSMTIREMRLLHGILHLSSNAEITPSTLGNYLGYPMSTMTSMLKGLETKKFIRRTTVKSDLRKLLIALDRTAVDHIDHFMTLRISTVAGIESQLKPDEQRLLESSFQILKVYSRESMTQ